MNSWNPIKEKWVHGFRFCVEQKDGLRILSHCSFIENIFLLEKILRTVHVIYVSGVYFCSHIILKRSFFNDFRNFLIDRKTTEHLSKNIEICHKLDLHNIDFNNKVVTLKLMVQDTWNSY